MTTLWKMALAAGAAIIVTHAAAQVSFFEREDFQGQAFTTDRPIQDMRSLGYSERIGSVVVAGGQWEFCDDAQFGGRCVVAVPGQYASLRALGLRGHVMSVRAVNRGPGVGDPHRPPAPVPWPMPVPVASRVTLYEHDDYRGQTFTTDKSVPELRRFGFNDRASSAEVVGEAWEVCEDERFNARCIVLRPGRYPSLGSMGLNDRVSSVRAAARDNRGAADPRYPVAPVVPVAPPVVGQITFYEHDGFQGQYFTSDRPIGHFGRYGFNERASSVVVTGERWEVCDEPEFRGRCVVLRPGNYASLRSMNLNDRVSSARALGRDARIDDYRYAPAPVHGGPDYRRRQDERVYEVNISSVRAVVGSPEQRCWVERQQVAQEQGGASVPGAIAGAIIGGILGHQIGGGTGKDVATVGGAVAGAAIGANVGRDNETSMFQDVQRCERVAGPARPQYWDATYYFRGVEHRVQLASPPGPTITVNERGEPRW